VSSIYTLQTDIENLLKTKGWMTESLQKELGEGVASRIKTQFETEKAPSLRLSKMGPVCPRALWYSINRPEEAEPVQPWAQQKFSFGHFWETYALVLTKAAGHKVEGEQHVCELDGIKGHLDAIVDGCVVDYKSCSARQFTKFKSGNFEMDDLFGYLDQLDGYSMANRENPLVVVHDRAFLVAVHRDMGHVHVYEHRVRSGSIRPRIEEYKSVVNRSEPPGCLCETKEDGHQGNRILGTKASYSPQKWTCFPSLRCFLFKNGPMYVSSLVRKPYGYLREVDRYGNEVHPERQVHTDWN